MTNSEEISINSGKKRGLRFFLKVFLTFFLLLGVAGGIAIYYVYSKLVNDDRFEPILKARLSNAVNMQVDFDNLEISFPRFSVSNARIATSSAQLKVDARIGKIFITPDFWAAFGGQLLLDSLSVSSATIEIETAGLAARPQADEGVTSSASLDLQKMDFPMNALHAQEIRVNYRDRATGKTFQAFLKQANLEKSMLSSSLPFNISLVSDKYAELQVFGQIYWPDNIQASIRLSKVNLAEASHFVPEEYRAQFSQIKNSEINFEVLYKISQNSLKISNFLLRSEPGVSLKASAEISSLSPVNGTLRAAVESMDAALLLKMAGNLIPAEYGLVVDQGSIGAEAEIEIRDSAPGKIIAKVKPSYLVVGANALPDKLSMMTGQFVYDGSSFNISGLKAAFAGSSFELSQGQAELEPLAFNGELKASADFEKLWSKIENVVPEGANRLKPSGKMEYSGNIAYREDDFKLDGKLDSSQIRIVEAKTGASAQLEDIHLKLSGIGYESGVVEIESLQLKGAGGNVSFHGTIDNGEDPAFDVKAAGGINLEDFSALAASIFKLQVRPRQFGGQVNVDLALGGKWSDLQPSGSISFKNAKADFRDRGMFITGLSGDVAANVRVLDIKKLDAELFGGKLELSGSMKDFKRPLVNVKASIRDADLGKVRSFIGLNFPDMPKEIDINGKTDMKILVTGPIAQPKLEGSSNLKGVKFFHPAVLRPLEGIAGPIAFDNAGLSTSKIVAKWGNSVVGVKGSLKNWGKLISDFSFAVEPLDATDAAGFFLKDTGYKLYSAGKGFGKISGELEKIKVDGQVLLPKGLFTAPVAERSRELFRFPFANLQAKFSYFQRVFRVDSAAANLFNGNITAAGLVDLNVDPIGFNFNTNMKQIETSSFLKENSRFSSVLRGGVDGRAHVMGDITGLASVNGNASLVMKNGAYTSPPVVQKICEQLNAMHLASGTIDNVSGDYVIANGRISSKNTMAKSKDGKMTYSGSVGLDTSLDGTMNLELNRAACLQSQILRQLVGNQEVLEIPVSVKGTLMSPSIGMPLEKMLKETAKRSITQTLEKKASDVLGKLFGVKKTEPEQPDSKPQVENPEPKKENPEPKNDTAPNNIEKKIKNLGNDLKSIFKF